MQRWCTAAVLGRRVEGHRIIETYRKEPAPAKSKDKNDRSLWNCSTLAVGDEVSGRLPRRRKSTW